LARLRADWIEKAQHFQPRLGGALVDPKRDCCWNTGISRRAWIEPVEVAVLMESMKIELQIGSKIEGFGQRIQFSLRAECAMICSRDG